MLTFRAVALHDVSPNVQSEQKLLHAVETIASNLVDHSQLMTLLRKYLYCSPDYACLIARFFVRDDVPIVGLSGSPAIEAPPTHAGEKAQCQVGSSTDRR